MPVFTIVHVYRVPAANLYEATDQFRGALELRREKDYLVRVIVRPEDDRDRKAADEKPAANGWAAAIKEQLLGTTRRR